MTDKTLDELRELTIIPCTRCWQCDFKSQGECKNPYKECSVCAVIRKLADDFQSALSVQDVESRIVAATHQRNLVVQQGHNLDCMQCGFKDSVVERYLSDLTYQQGEKKV